MSSNEAKVDSKKIEKVVEQLISETSKQGRSAAVTVVTAVAGLACVTSLVALVIMSDDRLMERAQQQVNTLLDTTGRIVGACSTAADHIAPRITSLEDRVSAVAKQWEQVDRTRF